MVLFVLPGFAAWRFYTVLVPSRRKAGDTEVLIGSIAGSAAIWIVAAAGLAAVAVLINWVTSWRGGKSWHIDLFGSLLRPSLTAHEFGFQSIGPGVVLTVLAITGGILAGAWMRKDGKLRVVKLGPLKLGRFKLGEVRFDPNPRVWSSFIATERGAVFRLRLKSGKFIVGQIADYSTDPNDDVLELTMSDYSIAESATSPLEPADSKTEVLIRRDDIELIERLPERRLVADVAPPTQPPPAARAGQ
ncbi:MAG: DUF6338 family protein [Candidatus Dormibacteraceae bacterium]